MKNLSSVTACASGVAMLAAIAVTPVASCAQSPSAMARTVTVDTHVSAGRMNLRLNGGNGYTPIARLQSGGWKVFIKPMEYLTWEGRVA